MVRAFEQGAEPPEGFDELAVDIARFQAEHVEGYARLCAARGVVPDRTSRAAEFPAVPTDAFKVSRVFAFGEADAAHVFRTSGTTTGARGVHAMRTAATYDAAALAFGRVMLAEDLPASSAVVVIGPSSTEAPDSSLAHMCDRFARALGPTASPEHTFFVRGGDLQVEALRARIAGLAGAAPAIVLSTSFALVHLVDALRGDTLPLPPGSRIMQTGGYKGRSREVPEAELRADIARTFAVTERDVVGEYGMTELSSQLWETTRGAGGVRGVYAAPPWVRVTGVDPETLAPVVEGDVGLARIEDLANVDSAVVVLAQDRIRRVAGGVELLGRAPGAPPRGCSIAIDEMLTGGR
jgi:hypothetical protein